MTSFPQPQDEQNYGLLQALRDALLNRRRLAEKGTEQAMKWAGGMGDVPRPNLSGAANVPQTPQEIDLIKKGQPFNDQMEIPGGTPQGIPQGYGGPPMAVTIAPGGVLKAVGKLLGKGGDDAARGVKETGEGAIYRAPEGFENARPQKVVEPFRKRLDNMGGEQYRASPGTDFEVSNSLAPKAFREAGEGGIYRAPEEAINPNLKIPPQFNLEDIARALGKRAEDVTQMDVDQFVRMIAP